MYCRSTVKVSRTVLSYTLASALAELGQYTGLLLGVSLVRLSSSVIEMAAEEARDRGGGGCCSGGRAD